MVTNHPIVAKGEHKWKSQGGRPVDYACPQQHGLQFRQAELVTVAAKCVFPGTKSNAEPVARHLPSRRPGSYLVAMRFHGNPSILERVAIHLHLNKHMVHISGFAFPTGPQPAPQPKNL